MARNDEFTLETRITSPGGIVFSRPVDDGVEVAIIPEEGDMRKKMLSTEAFQKAVEQGSISL